MNTLLIYIQKTSLKTQVMVTNMRLAENLGIRMPRLQRTFSTTVQSDSYIVAHNVFQNMPTPLRQFLQQKKLQTKDKKLAEGLLY